MQSERLHLGALLDALAERVAAMVRDEIYQAEAGAETGNRMMIETETLVRLVRRCCEAERGSRTEGSQ